MTWLFTSGGQSIKIFSSSISPSNEYSELISLGLTGLISLQSKGLSKVFSNTTVQKHQFFGIQPSLQSISHIHAASSVGKESSCNAGDPGSIPGLGRSAREGIRLPTPVFLGFPCVSAGKESACNMGDLGSIPGLGRYPGEGKGYQFSIMAWRIPWTV